MTCWIAWALLCFVVYVPVGAHTLHRIRNQLKEARSKHNTNVCAPVGVHFRESPHTVIVTLQRPSDAEKQSTSSTGCHSDRHRSETYDSAPVQKRRATIARLSALLTTMTTRLQPRRALQKDSALTVEQRRIRNLQRVYRNLSVQYYGISVAIGCFLISAILQAVDGYVSARQNDVAVPQVVGNLVAGWLTVMFCFLTVFCLFWRSFDPSLSVDVEDEQCLPIITRARLASLQTQVLRLVRPKLRNMTAVETGSEERSHDDNTVSNGRLPPTSYCHSYAGPSDRNHLQVPRTDLPGRGANSLPEYPSLYYVTPFGNVPATTLGNLSPENRPDRSKSLPHKTATSTRGRGTTEIRRPLPSCSLLAEHGSAYKPAASSFGQWRQTHLSPPSTPPERSTAPLLGPFPTMRDGECSL